MKLMPACGTSSCTSIFADSSGAEKATAVGTVTSGRARSSANRNENRTGIYLTATTAITQSGNRRILLFPRWRLLLRRRVRVAQDLAQSLIAERRRDERKHEHQQREKCQ